MRHLAAAVKNHGLDLVSFAKEPHDLIFPHLVIVLGGRRPKLHFLELRAFLMASRLVFAFTFLIEIFAVVRDLANGRVGGWRDFYNVQSSFARKPHRFKRLHYAQLGAFLIDDANFARPDPFVYPDAIIRPETSLGDKPTSRTPALPGTNQYRQTGSARRDVKYSMETPFSFKCTDPKGLRVPGGRFLSGPNGISGKVEAPSS